MRCLAVALLIVAVTACTPHEKDDLAQGEPRRSVDTPGTAPATGTGGQVAPPQTKAPESQIAGATEPRDGVQLVEYQIRMPQTLAAGQQTFTITNAGKEQHAFEIHGSGVHAASQRLSRGDSTTVTVDLKPGTYEVYCPVDGHKGKGMVTTVTVQ